jgi:hypothetical protein
MITALDQTDIMRRTINHGLMVAWINTDLLGRAANDVRTSTVFYDEDTTFVVACPAGIDWQHLEQKLHDAGVRYWSKGVV